MRAGFTLVELSIVLVIIGLIIGGVLGGQELIRQSELRGVVNEMTSYARVINIFRLKYSALPGDFANAESYWGTSSGGCPYNTSNGTETCNGNGNGLIETAGEYYHAWRQLNDAGLIKDTLTGMSSPQDLSGIRHDVIGLNVPPSIYPQMGYALLNGTPGYISSWSYPTVRPGTFLYFATCCNSGTLNLDGGKVNKADMKNIDAKMDDGQPDSGRLTIHRGLLEWLRHKQCHGRIGRLRCLNQWWSLHRAIFPAMTERG